LRENFKYQISNNKLEIVNSDVLELPEEFFSIFFEEKSAKREKNLLGSNNYKLVGNIPYYITGALFKKFLQSDNPPKSITFVVQKEVAERIIAKNNKESILSISIKVYGTPEFGGVIKAGSFYPKPKVDSGIVAVRNITPPLLTGAVHSLDFSTKNLNESCESSKYSDSHPLTLRGEPEKKFFEILKTGFSHKRKLLIKNLKTNKEIFKKCGIPEKARAENLKVEDWLAIARELT
jgi:16S rRNA (adenine1518-N6/adenine1519-N6)-dimethyltransferase